MNIGNINSTPFKAYTDSGNPYKRSNTGQHVGLITGLGVSAYVHLQKDTKLYLSEAYKVIAEKTTKSNAKIRLAASIALSTALIGGFFVGIGAIADSITNKMRRHVADEIAQGVKDKTKKQSETN